MNKLSQPSFLVVGIEARTNNKSELTQSGIIPKQWERFMKENIMQKIPNKISDAIIAGYTDYESNKDGEYTFFIGAKVSSIESIPDFMTSREVPASQYEILTSDKGAVWEVVQKLWKNIWNEKEEDRVYLFDYEVYDSRVADPTNSQVDIYLSVK